MELTKKEISDLWEATNLASNNWLDDWLWGTLSKEESELYERWQVINEKLRAAKFGK